MRYRYHDQLAFYNALPLWMAVKMGIRLSERLSTRRLKGPEKEPVQLTRKRIYILPTRYGYYFAVLLLVLLLGSINYNNSLGYALTFLLGSLSIISILHTHRNILSIAISSSTAAPVFSGQEIYCPVYLENKNRLDKNTVCLQAKYSTPIISDLPSFATTKIFVKEPALRRGRHVLGRVKIYSTYPLGLFQAWSWVELPSTFIVYPKPEENCPPPETFHQQTGDSPDQGTGQDDFDGLHVYRTGDSIRHIAWKHYSKTYELYTKVFTGGSDKKVWLDMGEIPQMSVEKKLSRMCSWILDCHGKGYQYGLKINDKLIDPSRGETHLHKCLQELAAYPDTATT